MDWRILRALQYLNISKDIWNSCLLRADQLQVRYADPVLFKCWANLVGPAFKQSWINVSCLQSCDAFIWSRSLSNISIKSCVIHPLYSNIRIPSKTRDVYTTRDILNMRKHINFSNNNCSVMIYNTVILGLDTDHDSQWPANTII